MVVKKSPLTVAVRWCGVVPSIISLEPPGAFLRWLTNKSDSFADLSCRTSGSRATVSDGDQCHRSSGVQDFELPERSTGRKPPYAKAKWMECEPVPSYRTCSMASQLLRCRPEAASFIGLGFDNVHTETTSLKRARMVLERTG